MPIFKRNIAISCIFPAEFGQQALRLGAVAATPHGNPATWRRRLTDEWPLPGPLFRRGEPCDVVDASAALEEDPSPALGWYVAFLSCN